MTRVAAVVLAAGKGQRMGQPKLFLDSGGRTFLELVIALLESTEVPDINIVVRGEDRERADGIAKSHQICVNQHPENGPLSSLRIGLDAAPGFDGYLVMPVDHPFVKAETISELIKAFQQNSDEVIKPAFRGKDGHPVIIPSSLSPTITGEDREGGLAGLIRDSGLRITRIEIADMGTVKNINTTGDIK